METKFQELFGFFVVLNFWVGLTHQFWIKPVSVPPLNTLKCLRSSVFISRWRCQHELPQSVPQHFYPLDNFQSFFNRVQGNPANLSVYLIFPNLSWKIQDELGKSTKGAPLMRAENGLVEIRTALCPAALHCTDKSTFFKWLARKRCWLAKPPGSPPA